MIKTLLFFFHLTLLSVPAFAQVAAGDWIDEEGGKTRLFVVGQEGRGAHKLAWHIALDGKWKTYWRSPGEAGLPPRLSFEGSTNFALADVNFPLPDRFDFYGIETFGYGGDFVLPIAVTAKDPAKPVRLNVQVDYMVCDDICIPLKAAYQTILVPGINGAKADRALYEAAMDQVPLKNTDGPLQILSAKVRGPAGKQKLAVQVGASKAFGRPDLLIEAEAVFGLGSPRFALAGGAGKGLFVVDVDGGEDKVSLKGQTITLTLIGGKTQAVERTLVVQ